MTNRSAISLLIYGMVQGVLFGAILLAVLYIPVLKANAAIFIPLAVLLSVIVAIPLAWKIAPKLRARHQRRMARKHNLA
ncbi:MAG: hypothetical protein GYB49_03600 [Alphaproteobacteria bacterium]|nr:hypothetical protein [Hyphomonas sp.]MBR9806297.1 hypothetical protein [Alphaproteobacteria bacterium]|tara:strand:+ start:915 stop:1151 length:237 start_codon:yes stop_codon:yes gene_type:complete